MYYVKINNEEERRSIMVNPLSQSGGPPENMEITGNLVEGEKKPLPKNSGEGGEIDRTGGTPPAWTKPEEANCFEPLMQFGASIMKSLITFFSSKKDSPEITEKKSELKRAKEELSGMIEKISPSCASKRKQIEQLQNKTIYPKQHERSERDIKTQTANLKRLETKFLSDTAKKLENEKLNPGALLDTLEQNLKGRITELQSEIDKDRLVESRLEGELGKCTLSDLKLAPLRGEIQQLRDDNAHHKLIFKKRNKLSNLENKINLEGKKLELEEHRTRKGEVDPLNWTIFRG